MRAQSCSGWYLRSGGYEASAKVLALLAVERLGADLGGPRLAANVDLEGGARLGAAAGEVRHADALVQARRQRPARHLAAADHRVALAGDPRPREHEGDEALGRAVGPRTSHRLGADEARGLLAAPAQPGLDRPARLHEVVAVEVEADLEAQRVPRAQARGLRAALRDGVPDGAGVLGLEQQFDAVLAGVAGPAHEHVRRPGDGHPLRAKARGQLTFGEIAHDPPRLRPLHREHRVVVQAVAERDVEPPGVSGEPVEV